MANFASKPVYSDDFIRALGFAASAHSRQLRNGGFPYFSHLMAVSALVFEAGGTEAEAMSALLHDAVEDVGCKLSTINDQFGATVSNIVAALTEQQELPFAERKDGYVSQVGNADDSAKLISCADKLHNLRSYATDGRSLWKPKTKAFYGALMPIYQGCDRVPQYWIEEMQRLLLSLDCNQATAIVAEL